LTNLTSQNFNIKGVPEGTPFQKQRYFKNNKSGIFLPLFLYD